MSNSLLINHLLWRAGFGPSVAYQPASTIQEEVKSIFNNSKTFIPLSQEGEYDGSLAGRNMMTETERIETRKNEREIRNEINVRLLERYRTTSAFLREKMTLFWMGHFACRMPFPPFAVDYYNTIGENSLGKFDVLLKSMVRNAAMLQFLNNNQNRKSSPNENFARELMELFTLGRGSYTEEDVREGARAMSGWAYTKTGDFIIRNEHHDNDIKTFLGESGNFDADDLVRIILSKKQCARFITAKIFRFFVNDEPHQEDINSYSNDFFSSGYDIEKLMRAIFSSDMFYEKQNLGSKIKSPVELITGINRMLPVTFQNPQAQTQVMRVLGQVFFDPPNVSGWPSGKNWIDSSTMIYRTRLPEMLIENAASLVNAKEEFDNMEIAEVKSNIPLKAMKTSYDATSFIKKFQPVPMDLLVEKMSVDLLQLKLSQEKKLLVESFTRQSSGSPAILKTAIYLMSMPEYQLC